MFKTYSSKNVSMLYFSTISVEIRGKSSIAQPKIKFSSSEITPTFHFIAIAFEFDIKCASFLTFLLTALPSNASNFSIKTQTN